MKKNDLNIAGVDYGSKLAGTTVIAHLEGQMLSFYNSIKKKDADAFLLTWVREHTPTHLFIDAPLSLPGVYRAPDQYDDYFYRQADREVRAMSPMFLGGLTARAMKLKRALSRSDLQIMEIYPSKLADLLEIRELGYKKKKAHLEGVLHKLANELSSYQWPAEAISNWHQVDALLALLSGLRYLEGAHLTFGDEEEGRIIV